MELGGQHIVVVGLGITGIATATFCWRRDARVTAVDAARTPATEAAAESLGPLGVEVLLGAGPEACVGEADLIVLSPGVPHDLPVFREAAARGVPVIGEIELAYRFLQCPIAAVTGTNGKTTTTTLLGEMLRASGASVFVGGNIGEPLIGFADGGGAVDWVVAEVSSFQLDTIRRFRPRIGVVLNVSDDHLDRYPDLEAYGASKFRLLENQTPGDVAVLNGDDAFTAARKPPAARRLVFGRGGFDGEGASIAEDRVRIRMERRAPVELDLTESPLSGLHNQENIAAAALAALSAGATPEGIRTAIRGVAGLPHRMEWVATVAGVRYVDDSKATNVGAVLRAVQGLPGPAVLIMGGLDKGGSYAPLADLVRERVRRLVLLGQAAPVIQEALGGLTETVRAASMAEAVGIAAQAAAPGDTVLLSPACASFDMYKSYAERGADFARAVRSLGS